MKSRFRLTIMLTALAAVFGACEKQVTPVDNHNETVTSEKRDIIYTVGDSESRRSLATETEWDALLDQLCDQAHGGSEVSFYNIRQSHQKTATKESHTINTTSRDEIKSWMKEMERQGLTVRVTYDSNSGTWSGEAYATAPARSTSDLIVDTWHFSCMVVSQMDSTGRQPSRDLYEPDSNGGSMYYTFSSDGTVTLTVNGMDGTTATDHGTWSLSADGVLTSQLLPNGEDWNVNWITTTTMVLSHGNLGSEDRDTYYQLQFDAVAESEE